MKVQPTVTFRGIPNSQALEADIRARLARLEKFCPDIISAQVVVELGERHHRDGKRWRVRLDVSVPGEHIIVKNESTLRPDVRAREVQATRKQDESVLEVERSKVKPPPLYKVLLLNDDYTPMDFVVAVLQKFFAMSREQATRIMLKVHREGVGVCGTYPRDVAASKVEQVSSYARQHQHPLACVMEES
jgi:ATP-dependent Clp protease adaptor protein ClpS